jgi:uncharacterized membrane protein
MFKTRLEALSDGIYAIVMTILVLEIRVPELEHFTEDGLLHAVLNLWPIMFAYFLSIMIIMNSWATHNFLFSLMARTINRTLVNINFVSLAVLSLIPFSAYLLGKYPESRVAVAVYALNVAAIAIMAYLTRNYIFFNKEVESADFKNDTNFSHLDFVYGSVRLVVALFGSLAAVIAGFFSNYISLIILVLQGLILVVPGLIKMVTVTFHLEKMFIKSAKIFKA